MNFCKAKIFLLIPSKKEIVPKLTLGGNPDMVLRRDEGLPPYGFHVFSTPGDRPAQRIIR